MSWIIGYGSLVWRPAFAHEETAPARLTGWTRRFWQGSPDHRGTPENPGRVATVLRDPEVTIGVRVYRIRPNALPAIRAALDVRERAGYALETVQVELADGRKVTGELYAAAPGNPSWLGPAPVPEIAATIRTRHGPSGSNLEYVQELARALAHQGTPDAHVNALLAFASPFGEATDPAEQAVRRYLGDAIGTRVVVLGDTSTARETAARLASWGAVAHHVTKGQVGAVGPIDLIIDAGAERELAAWAESFDAPVLTPPLAPTPTGGHERS